MTKRIGLFDCDRKTQFKGFPNLALMKISAYYKGLGYDTGVLGDQPVDAVFASKVFSFSPDIPEWLVDDGIPIYRGGSGYVIRMIDGREVYDKAMDKPLDPAIEHIMPDYGLYGITDTAYGFMSRGCPRGCDFCHVGAKEGRCAQKVADLREFWSGQKYIELCDPNTLACPDWRDILKQLAESRAYVDFNQGLDIRLMTPEKLEAIKQVRIKSVHFAFDRMKDADLIKKNLLMLRDATGLDKHKVVVFVLTGFDTTQEEDEERVRFIHDDCGFCPYVMVYNNSNLKRGDPHSDFQRWVNWKPLLYSFKTYADYKKARMEGKI